MKALGRLRCVVQARTALGQTLATCDAVLHGGVQVSEYANAALHRGYSSGCNDLCKSAETQVGWLRHILRVRIRVGRVSERFKALSPEHFEVEMRGICQVWSWVSKGGGRFQRVIACWQCRKSFACQAARRACEKPKPQSRSDSRGERRKMQCRRIKDCPRQR